MNLEYRYAIIICWSEADQVFIAEAPEPPGCAADAPTYREAFAAIETVIGDWIVTAPSLRREIPLPRGRLLYA